MDEYNEFVFYLLAWLAFWLIIEIKFYSHTRIYLNYKKQKKSSTSKSFIFIWDILTYCGSARAKIRASD